MILSKQSFRDIKTAVMAIEGHPGSARLGEILARSFGFRDYHDLKTQLDRDEVALDWQPRIADLDFGNLSTQIPEHPQAELDIAATALFLHYGGLVVEDLSSYPEMHGGRIILTEFANRDWQKAAAAYLTDAFTQLGGVTWAFEPSEVHWSGIDTLSGDEEYTLHVLDDGQGNDDPLHDESYRMLDEFDNSHHLGFTSFMEHTFLRIARIYPAAERRIFRHLVFDQSGIYAVLGDEGSTVEALFLIVQHDHREPPSFGEG